MNNSFLCVEILGEPSYHKTLQLTGYSGRGYCFFYNTATRSHLRAYRNVDAYRAERIDLHRASNVWPLLAELLEAEQIDPQCWTEPAPAPSISPEPKHAKRKEER